MTAPHARAEPPDGNGPAEEPQYEYAASTLQSGVPQSDASIPVESPSRLPGKVTVPSLTDNP